MAELVVSASNALLILLDRLRWPIPMVRWQSAMRIRELMENPNTTQTTVEALLHYLGSRRTESEVCSILTIFYMTSSDFHPERSEVVRNIRCPSILSDFLLERLFGWGKGQGGWNSCHSGRAPDGFSGGTYFEEHKCAHVPPVLFNSLQELEQQSGLPFLSQWAFEWRNLCDNMNAKFTRYPEFFDDTMELRSGIVGQYQTFQSELYRSAHIRALSYAVGEWKMPISRALDELLVHVPLIRGLCDIEPVAKPKWLDDFPSDCLTSGLQENWLLDFFNSETFLNSGVLSFVIPFDTKDAKYGHISASLYYASPDFEVCEPNDVYQPIRLVDSSKELSIEGLWPTRQMSEAIMAGTTGDAVPVCNEVLPMPFGHWMGHYFQTGFPTVASYLLDAEHHIRVRKGSVELVAGDHVRATTSVWHDEWTQHYAKEGGKSRNGVYVSASPEFAGRILSKPPTGLKAGWIVKYEVWQRERDFDDYVSKREHKFVFTGTSS